MISYPASRLLPLAVRAVIEQVAARATGRSLRVSPWIPIAQVEDDDLVLSFPEDQRLTPERLQLMVRNFDPRVYRPAVICAMDGPAHYTGEYGEPLGYLTALDFDGVHLWGQAVEIVEPDGTGRIEDAVSGGCLGRSIGWWMEKPGVDGGIMLRHLALLSGEPEGQALLALPPLTQYFKSAFGAEAGSRADGEKFVTSRATAAPAGRSEDTMDEKQILSEIKTLLAGAQAETKADIKEAVDGAVSEVKSEVADIRSAVDPLKAQIETVRAENAAKLEVLETGRAETTAELAALKTEIAAARAESGQRLADARESGYRSTLEGLVGEGKFAAGEVASEIEGLMVRTEEKATERLTLLKARQPLLGPATRAALKIQGPEGAEPLVVPIPPGADPQAFELAARAEASLPADKKNDPEAYRAAVKALLPSAPVWTN